LDWIVYVLGPIDHDWDKLKTVRETVADIANYEDEFTEAHDLNTDSVRSFL